MNNILKTAEIKASQKNMINFVPSISTIALNISSLHTPIKRQRLPNWVKKQDPNCMVSIRNCL
jgi:hypothetical protein